MSNALKIVLIILLSIIALALIGILCLLLVRGDKFNFSIFSSRESTTIVEEKNIEELKNINIDIDYADLEINLSNDNNIDIKLYSEDAKEHSISIEEDINVVFKQEKKIFSFFRKSPRAVISIPKDYDKIVTVKGGVLDIKGCGTDKLILNVTLNVGDVKVDNMDIANIKIQTGDVKLDTVNDLTVDSKTGDIKVKNVNKKLDITSNVGDVKIDRVYLTLNSKINNSTGDVKIGKVNDIYVDGKTNVGDVKIEGGDRKSDIELSIKSHIGDIKVG